MDTSPLPDVLGAANTAAAASTKEISNPVDEVDQELDTAILRSEAPWVFRYLGEDELKTALEIWESAELPAELAESALQSAQLNIEAAEICRQALQQLAQMVPAASSKDGQKGGKGKGRERNSSGDSRTPRTVGASSSGQLPSSSGTTKTRSSAASNGTSDTWPSVWTPQSAGSTTSLESMQSTNRHSDLQHKMQAGEPADDGKRKNWAKERIGQMLKLRIVKLSTATLGATATTPTITEAPVLPPLPFQDGGDEFAITASADRRPVTSGQTSQSSYATAPESSGQTSKKARNLAKLPKLPHLRKGGSTAECASCLDDVPKRRSVPLGCKHHYCIDCFGQMIMSASQNEAQWPPRCCLSEIPRKLIIRNLKSDRLKMFHEKEKEYAVKASERFYCTNVPDCGKFFMPQRKGQDTTTCTHCKHVMCTACRGAAHAPGERCRHDRELQATLERAELEGWRVCANCHAIVEHNTGCQHMTCRCGYHFCYVCNAVWNTCSCSPADLDRYLERIRHTTVTGPVAAAAPVAGAAPVFVPQPRRLPVWRRMRVTDRDVVHNREQGMFWLPQQRRRQQQHQAYDRAPTPIPAEHEGRDPGMIEMQQRRRQAAIDALARRREEEEAQEQRELEMALAAIAEQQRQDMADRQREEEAEAEQIEGARVAGIEDFSRHLDQQISQLFTSLLAAMMSRHQQHAGAVESVRTEVQRLEIAAREDAESRRTLRKEQLSDMQQRHARHMAEFKKRVHRDIISEAERRRTQPADSIDPEFTLALFDKAEGRFASLAETQQREMNFLSRSHARSFVRAQIAGRTQVISMLRGVGVEWVEEEEHGKEAGRAGASISISIGQYADTELYRSANLLMARSLTRNAVDTIADLKWLRLVQRLAGSLVLDRTAQLMLSGADAPMRAVAGDGGQRTAGDFAASAAAAVASAANTVTEESWRGGSEGGEAVVEAVAAAAPDDWPLRRPGFVAPAQ